MCSFEVLQASQPFTQHHIKEDMDYQQHYCQIARISDHTVAMITIH
jgi:hypothetical protein